MACRRTNDMGCQHPYFARYCTESSSICATNTCRLLIKELQCPNHGFAKSNKQICQKIPRMAARESASNSVSAFRRQILSQTCPITLRPIWNRNAREIRISKMILSSASKIPSLQAANISKTKYHEISRSGPHPQTLRLQSRLE